MAAASDPDLLVLHCLRLKWPAPAETVVQLTGLPLGEVVDRLDSFAGKAWVRHTEGVRAGWSLTPAGRVEGAGRLAEELAATGTAAAIGSAYEGFGALNQRFLQLCTDWQLRPSGPRQRSPAGEWVGPTELNDHRDAEYDRGVIGQLRAIDGAIQPVCADLAAALARFGHYGERFRRALRHIDAGEIDWFTRPLVDSYHTVWFELHEDLLATLGLDRSRAAGDQRADRPSGGERADRPSGGERRR